VNKINEVVIDTLNKCLRPYLVDLSFNFNNENIKDKKPVLINEPINNFTYQDEVVSYSYILDSKNKFNVKNLKQPILVTIKGKDPINDIKEEINLLSPENIIMLNNGDNLLKIIIGQGLKYDKNLLESTDKEIEFAKKYQLLSKNTALFGEILKDGSSPQSELIKVNINDERNKILMRPGRAIFSGRGRVTNAFGRGGRMGGRVLMKTKAMPSAKMTKSIGSAKLALAKTTLAPRGAAKIEKNSAQKKTDYQKKPSFVQREDGSIGIMDEFNDMLVS